MSMDLLGLGHAVSESFDSAGDALDKLITSDEERLQAGNVLAKLKTGVLNSTFSFAAAIQQALTKRHQSDMESDNAFSKNIRPAVVTIVVAAYLTAVFLPPGRVSPAALTSLEDVLWLVLSFYFGGRSVEKVVSILKSAGSVMGKLSHKK